ncbi:MAG: hypothetical protein SF123_02195 [Chloroflexota bacterium]|nr:hypothetical protein [Chloroflexota bacterium]
MFMETPLYQIVARTPDGITRIVEVANTALTVGSDETCDLPLPVEFAEPTHLRLAPLPGRGVLLVNLAANGRTRVEGAAVERASSMVWEVNQVVDIGGVLLRLLPLPPPATAKPVKVVATVRDTNATAVEDGLLAPAEEDPGLPSPDEKPALQDHSGLPSPSGTPRSGEGQEVRAGIDEPFPHLPRLPDEDDEPPTLLGDEDDDATPDKPLPAVVAPIPVMPSVGAQSIAPLPSPVPVPAPQPSAERHTDAHEERTRMTEIYMGAIPDEVAYVRPRETRGYETLVKDWHYAGTLGLQMTMREVRLAQGERVRVPFSVSNDGVEPLQVQVYVTGLPEAWIGLSSAPLALNPGEVRLIDLMLHPHEGAPAQALSAAIYAHDVNGPHAKVSSTFQVTIKAQRDVVGWLQPVTAQAPGMTELVLQNHTQATAHIFLSSGSGDERLRVAFDRHDLQLPAGETVRVPVRLHVARRPLWVGRQAGLYVSVKAGSRAAIVYEAVARIRPRIGWTWLVILLLALVAAALIAVYVRGV